MNDRLTRAATMAYRAWCAAANELPIPFDSLPEIDRTRWLFVARAVLGNMHITPELERDPPAMIGLIRQMLTP